jgi:hypothetical protein
VINPTTSLAIKSLFLVSKLAASKNLPEILFPLEDNTEYAYPTLLLESITSPLILTSPATSNVLVADVVLIPIRGLMVLIKLPFKSPTVVIPKLAAFNIVPPIPTSRSAVIPVT